MAAKPAWGGSIFYIGHLLFLSLLILSIIHYRERIAHVDTALQFFKWVQLDRVEVEAHRYSAILPQLAVKSAKAFGASLQTLMLIGSLMHVIVPWLVFAIVAHFLRVPWAAAATALAAVLATRLTFFGIVLEVNYLLSYPMLLVGILSTDRGFKVKWFQFACLVFSLLICLFVHPIGALICLFIFGFVLILRLGDQRQIIILAMITLLWIPLSRFLFPPSGYEDGLYASTHQGVARAAEIFTLPSFDFLLGHTYRYTNHYVPLWILMGLTLFLIARRKQWVLLFWVSSAVTGYILLNVFTYYAGETAMFMEKNYLPLAILVAIPLMYEVHLLPLRWQRLAMIPFVIVLFLQFRGITIASRQINERYERLAELINDIRRTSHEKVIVPEAEFAKRNIDPSWAIAFETMLISSHDGPERTITVVRENDPDFDISNEKVHLRPIHSQYPPDSLDSRYFDLQEGPYRSFP